MEGRGREEGPVLPEQQSKARRNAKESNRFERGENQGRQSLVLELHRASTCYSRAEQQMQWQAMDEAGQIGGERKGREKKKSCEDKRPEGGEMEVELSSEYSAVQHQCSVMQCSAAAGDVLTGRIRCVQALF